MCFHFGFLTTTIFLMYIVAMAVIDTWRYRCALHLGQTPSYSSSLGVIRLLDSFGLFMGGSPS